MTDQSRSSRPAKVLVVEDDLALRDMLVEELEDAGNLVRGVPGVPGALRSLERWAPDLILSDLRLPGSDGIQLLRETRGHADPPAFIVITAFGTVAQAVEALKEGADEFLTKPLNLDHLQVCVSRAVETRRLRHEVTRMRKLITPEDRFHGMIGQSRVMRSMFTDIRRVAAMDGPVLIIGESGTGKELVARAVHAESPRAREPFVALNCAGVPGPLFEAELFGHAAGAFTGAVRDRKGLFASAAGGTLLLDEIGEMPAESQAKMLRVLQDGRIRPVGADRDLPVDVRIIASTNRNLEQAVREGAFREDLFYRLETYTLPVPALRDRGDDLDLLAARFLAEFAEAAGREVRSFSADALDAIHACRFPGNVRELRNGIERGVAYAQGPELRARDLPRRLRSGQTSPPAPSDATQGMLRDLGARLPPLDEMERHYIRHVLDACKGNKQRAAAQLGIGRRTLYRKLGMEREP